MKKMILMVGAFILSLSSLSVSAAPPADYYQTITSQVGDDLKLELRAIVSGQRGYSLTPLSYDGARDALLASVDSLGNNQVRMIYTNDARPTSQWAATFNREHVWPQSRGTSSSPMRSDMHHLYLCDAGINSSRGNNLFGIVPTIFANEATNFTAETNDQNWRQGGVWFVSANHRGDIARSMLYMDTRYAHLTLVNRGETIGDNQMGYLDELLQWHLEDPVDAFEVARNDRVFSFQNNRNPYIDNPAWVGLAYGLTTSTGPTFSGLQLAPSIPADAETVTVSVTVVDTDGVAAATLFHRSGDTGPFSSIAMNNAGDVYTTISPIPGAPEGTLVQYYIVAEDTLANVSSFPILGALGPNSYVVTGDDPVLADLQLSPSSITASDSVHIAASVTDNDGNDATNLTVTAYWRLLGEVAFTSIAMEIVSGTTWQTMTPVPPQEVDSVVEYYVEAVDAGSASATLPAAGSSAPASWFVEEDVEFVEITLSNIATVSQNLLITEVAHSSIDAFTEFIEIANISLTQGYKLAGVGLSDCTHSEGGSPTEGAQTFPAAAVIPPGGVIVVFNRTTPSQSYIDTIPRVSNRNGAAVQVFARDARTFDDKPTGEMIIVPGGSLELADAGDNVSLYIGTTRVFSNNAVIDGMGYKTPGNGNLSTWGPGLSDANRVNPATNGAYRLGPVDTNTVADWASVATADLTPGQLPASFELVRSSVIFSSGAYDPISRVLTVQEDGAETVMVTLDTAPTGTVNVSFVITGGTSTNFQITAGGNMNFNTSNFDIPQQLTIAKISDGNAVADEVTIQVTGQSIDALVFTALEVLNSTVDEWMTLD